MAVFNGNSTVVKVDFNALIGKCNNFSRLITKPIFSVPQLDDNSSVLGEFGKVFDLDGFFVKHLFPKPLDIRPEANLFVNP